MTSVTKNYTRPHATRGITPHATLPFSSTIETLQELGTWPTASDPWLEVSVKYLGVVGCGRVLERYYLPALRGSTDWKVVAAIDPLPAQRQWMQTCIPGITTHEHLAQLPLDTEVDAVLIATPPEHHGSIAVEALRRGAHVFVEKPLTPCLAEAEALLDVSHERGRQIWVGFNRRFRLSYNALRRLLTELPKERILSIYFELGSDVQRWSSVSTYLGHEKLGGGVLDDVASHQLDLLPWLLGLPVSQVSARPEPGAPASVAVSIGLRFGGGLEAECRASHRGPSIERLEIRLDRGALVATRGGVTVTGVLPLAFARGLAGLRDRSRGIADRVRRRPNVTVGSFQRQLAEWAEVLRSGRSAIAADGVAGARCVGLIETCRDSLARDGAWLSPRLPKSNGRSS